MYKFFAMYNAGLAIQLIDYPVAGFGDAKKIPAPSQGGCPLEWTGREPFIQT
jgi:hypothetical protein